MQHLLLDDEHLAPDDLAALFFLRLVRPDRIPWWAAQWLAQGHDGESLRELAGEHGNDLITIERLLPDALLEMGVPMPERQIDAADAVFTYLARRCLEGRLSERGVARLVDQVVAAGGFDAGLYDLPLGGIFGLDDEWTGGWGRGEKALRADVRRACVAQVGTPGQGSRGRYWPKE